MTEDSDNIQLILLKLDTIMKRQKQFAEEINELSLEVSKLQALKGEEPQTGHLPAPPPYIPLQHENVQATNFIVEEIAEIPKPFGSQLLFPNEPELHQGINIEKFIGENLINKIGIIITIIGVAIGAKYSIDHDLISPTTRIILGYLSGLILIGFGYRLKNNYLNYSAVLVSGAMAIFYFITYFAYNFYQLMPQNLAFGLMVVFTVLTVYISLNYNKQVIAHIGLVGAYGVPFLLSNESGNMAVLFGYIAIINGGILVTAFKKYWKPLNFTSFVVTWLIYLFWFDRRYKVEGDFSLALTFLAIFFVTFYTIFLAFKLIQKEKFEKQDIWMLLSNSFIFYAIGYSLIDNYPGGKDWLGIFTLVNALVNLGVSLPVYRLKMADRDLFYFVFGLVLVFITIAAPVQMNGNWVTLFWVVEAAILFHIGRTKTNAVYEQLSFILIGLAIISQIQDWSVGYNIFVPDQPETRIIPIWNINFLSSMLFVAAIGYINILNNNRKYPSSVINKLYFRQFIIFALPAILVFTIYYSFFIEISTYWQQCYDANVFFKLDQASNDIQNLNNTDLINYRIIWEINYSILFLTILSFVNLEKLKNRNLGQINLAFNTLVIFVFLTEGLLMLSGLRESYLHPTLTPLYHKGIFNIVMRYISIFLIAVLIFSTNRYLVKGYVTENMKRGFELIFHFVSLWILSSELVNWMDLFDQSEHSYKLGLTILWGLYALLLISLGIWKRKKYLRIGAIVLFSFTLLKLFFYDISNLDTIAKTVIFVVLGVLLLIISFLYNKFKNVIIDE